MLLMKQPSGEVVELVYGTSLENWRRFVAYRGFESHPLRQRNGSWIIFLASIFKYIWENLTILEIYPSGWRGRFAKPLGLRKWPRGFKSLNLRQKTADKAVFFCYKNNRKNYLFLLKCMKISMWKSITKATISMLWEKKEKVGC